MIPRRAGRLLALLATVALVAGAPPAGALDWTLENFEVELRVDPQGGVDITERLTVDFTAPRHGIFRVIPVRYDVRTGFVHDLQLNVVAVLDGDARVLPYRARREGRNVHIRIGDPDRTVHGHQIYVLRYRVDRGVDFHADHDELYWNVTGEEWPVAIGAASAHVVLPAAVPSERVAFEMFTGPYGARERHATASYEPGNFTVRTTAALPPWSGLTFALGWPKGIVEPPGALARAGGFLRWNWPLLLPVVIGWWVWRRWKLRGRDPRAGRSVAVQYEPPPGLTPSEVGALLDERADLRDVTAAVVDLAVRGYLRIEVEVERVLGLFSRRTHALVRLDPPADAAPLRDHEQALLAGLFERGSKQVRLDELRERFYTHLPRIRSGIYGELVRAGLFEASPEAVRRRWTALGLVTLVAGGLLAVFWVRQQGLVSPAAFIPPLAGVVLAAGILVGVAPAMPRRTRRGVEMLLRARGLEEFVRRVEQPRIELQERTGLDPRQHFERVLPYAMALGVATRWASAFADLYTTPPSWYSGPLDGDGFSSLRFVSGLERMRSNLGECMTSSPRSSSGGGSGLGGGGSSGGGHGGGGGGAW